MFGFIQSKLNEKKRMKLWRSKNPYNDHMTLINDFDLDLVSVGNHTYGGLQVYNFNTKSHLRIGHFCSISGEVMFILNADHFTDHLSTYPFKVRVLKSDKYEAISKGDIVVDDDVWIGYRATILSGVHIGQGAIIAAGAVVTKDVPPYSIVGGVPAKVIRYRFDDEIIKVLMKIDYSQITDQLIAEHIHELYRKIDTVESALKILEWIPNKNI